MSINFTPNVHFAPRPRFSGTPTPQVNENTQSALRAIEETIDQWSKAPLTTVRSSSLSQYSDPLDQPPGMFAQELTGKFRLGPDRGTVRRTTFYKAQNHWNTRYEIKLDNGASLSLEAATPGQPQIKLTLPEGDSHELTISRHNSEFAQDLTHHQDVLTETGRKALQLFNQIFKQLEQDGNLNERKGLAYDNAEIYSAEVLQPNQDPDKLSFRPFG